MGKKSFLMLLLAVLMLGSAVQAKEENKKALSVDEIKAKVSAKLDARIAKLQEQKECFAKATTKKEIKECRVKYKHKKMKPKK